MKLFFKCGWNWSLKQGRWEKGLFPWEGPHLLVSPWLQQEQAERGMATVLTLSRKPLKGLHIQRGGGEPEGLDSVLGTPVVRSSPAAFVT